MSGLLVWRASPGKKPSYFLHLAIGYVVLIGVTAAYRSFQRQSILGGASAKAVVSGPTEESRLRLQDFRRIEVKQGKAVWNISAKDARLFEQGGETFLIEPSMIVYREDGTTVSIDALSAKLHVRGPALDRAVLEGKVVVSDRDSIFNTELAVYDAHARTILAPDAVSIRGEGYDIKGFEMRLALDEDFVTLSRQVSSRFITGGKVPKKLGPTEKRKAKP